MKTRLLINEELMLRVLNPSDADSLFGLVDSNRDHLREWLPWVDETRHVAVTRAFLEGLQVSFERQRSLHYGIFHHDQLVGMVGFHAFDWSNRLTSIGYWLARSACGKGIMWRSVAACLEEAFRLGMNRISIRCAIGNERSRRIPLGLGFSLEGIQRQAEWLNGRFADLEVFSLLASEWTGHLAATSARLR